MPTSTKRRGPRLKHQVHVDQLGFFGEAAPAAPDPALQQLADAVDALEPEHMTPMQALTTLASLKDAMKGTPGRKVPT